jgi:hypothetical protein
MHSRICSVTVDFVAKVLGVYTLLFILIHNFSPFFTVSSYVSYKLSYLPDSSLFAYGASGWGSIPSEAFSLITLFIIALEPIMFYLFTMNRNKNKCKNIRISGIYGLQSHYSDDD